jgi:hypothetical protein
MRSGLRKMSLLLLFLLLFQVLAAPALAASEHRANLSYQDASQNAQQGEVLSALDDIKEAFIKFKQFRDDPKGSIVRWVGGPFGMFITLLHEMINAIIGDANQADKAEWSGGSSEGGGGSGGDYDGPTNYIPPGAIPMPPGDWYFSGGMVGTTTKFIASVYSVPPASGIYYAYDVLHNLGVVPAYAANGVGFQGLQPILPVWKAFRNVSYAILAIAFVVIGIMIMFRVRISPQAVMTVENALPRVVGALVLITFSYAIAGFMIDLMYVVMGLGVGLLRANGVRPSFLGLEPTSTNVINAGFLSMLPPIAAGFQGAATFGFVTSMMLAGGIGTLVGAVIGGALPGVSSLTGGAIFGGLAKVGGAAGGLVGGLLFVLIWLIVALFLLIKLLIVLIKTYISVILLVILSPFQIMAGMWPGSPTGFGGWLKSLVANLLVFPAVAIVAMIGVFIFEHGGSGGHTLWYPPLMGPPDSGLGLVSSVDQWVALVFVKSVIGMGFLLLLPSIPDIVRSAMGVKGSGVGEMVKQSLVPVTAPAKLGGQYTVQRGVMAVDRRYEAAVQAQQQAGPGPSEGLKTVKAVADALRALGKAK